MRWVVILLIGVSVASAAPPVVEIHAHTQLALTRVRLRDNGMVEVTGQLVDKLTGEGIANEHVTINLGGQERTEMTGTDGTFTATLPGAPGPQEVVLGFRGADALEAATPLKVTTDPAKAQLELAIVKIADDPAGAKLRVDAITEGSPALQIQLAVADPGDDHWKPIPAVESGKEFVLSRAAAGGPGIHRVRATFPGDDGRQAASREATLELVSFTVTTMHTSSLQLAYEDELVVTGKVRDVDGRPVETAAVTLMSGDKRLAQGVTDKDGNYRFGVEGQLLGQGQWGIQVQTDPGKTYVKASRSEPAIVKVSAPQPVPVSYTVAAFIATGLAAGGFFIARKKPWQRLRRPAPPAEVPSAEGEIEVLPGGLVVAKPSIVSTLRRPADDGFSGVVRDTVRGRPIAEAVVSLVLGDPERRSREDQDDFERAKAREKEVRTAADGSFAVEKLAPGEWRAEVAAPGHVTERFGVTIPHRGELRGVRVDLVPVRERVFQLYRRAAEPVLPESKLWGIWSPRQIVDHVRTKRPSPALAELTDFVEEIYFSPRLAAETVLPQASERVDRAIHERARR